MTNQTQPQEQASRDLKTIKDDASLVVVSDTKKQRKTRGSVPELRHVLPDEVAKTILAAGKYGSMIKFLWATGARLSEVVGRQGVKVKDVMFQHSAVRLRTLKRRGEHYRMVPLPPSVMGELAQKIVAEALGPEALLWGFTRQYAYEVIHNAMLCVGVPMHRARPHALRHGHAFHALASGAGLPSVKNTLGHSSLLTTAVYCVASAEETKRAYSKINWG